MNSLVPIASKRSTCLRQSGKLVVVFLFFLGPLFSVESVPTQVDPFSQEPRSPSRREMTEEAYQVADKKWREGRAKWEASLTPEQLFAEQKRTDEKRRLEAEASGRAMRLRLPQPEDNYDWKQVALRKNLDAATIAQLEKSSSPTDLRSSSRLNPISADQFLSPAIPC
ncbi:MAG: hypothetical protein IPP19_16895 [Verrucomicrobia bacterium]|nr:hypothetical protein [Verrucomicrobiota bacterium]